MADIIGGNKNIRTQKTIKEMVANGGKTTSLAQAMRNAGYSEAYARNPQKIKKTKAWKSFVDEYFSAEDILKKHAQMFNAYKTHSMSIPRSTYDQEFLSMLKEINWKVVGEVGNKESDMVQLIIAVPDNQAKFNALSMAYKLHGLI